MLRQEKSWNFHGLIRLDRISEFNNVNSTNRYAPIPIISPRVTQGGQIRAGDSIELPGVPAGERLAARQPYTLRWPRDFQ